MAINDDATIPNDGACDASCIELEIKKKIKLKTVLKEILINKNHTMLSVCMHACGGDADSGLGELSRDEDVESLSL